MNDFSPYWVEPSASIDMEPCSYVPSEDVSRTVVRDHLPPVDSSLPFPYFDISVSAFLSYDHFRLRMMCKSLKLSSTGNKTELSTRLHTYYDKLILEQDFHPYHSVDECLHRLKVRGAMYLPYVLDKALADYVATGDLSTYFQVLERAEAIMGDRSDSAHLDYRCGGLVEAPGDPQISEAWNAMWRRNF